MKIRLCILGGVLVLGAACEDDDDEPNLSTELPNDVEDGDIDVIDDIDDIDDDITRLECTDDGGAGLVLPAGFCASVFAEDLGFPRHIAIGANGDVYVAAMDAPDGSSLGGLLVLRDDDDDGVADKVERVIEGGGSGVAVRDDAVFFGQNDRILRLQIEGDAVSSRDPIVVAAGLPADGDHPAKSLLLDDGRLIVNIGSATNACQRENRVPGSKGLDPCPELETRAGLWAFDADGIDQRFVNGKRLATGLRNGNALARRDNGDIWVAQNGRDQLNENWPDLFSPEDDTLMPAEELLLVEEGADYGWPYCFWNPELDARVLAPEYGGDGVEVDRCADLPAPAVVFPAHWAPLALVFAEGERALPEAFRTGAFVTFHGARFDANAGEGEVPGYSVGFVPFNGEPRGTFTEFATGFAGDVRGELPENAAHRPMGIAIGPDGSLFIGDDQAGTIWRVTFVGDE